MDAAGIDAEQPDDLVAGEGRHGVDGGRCPDLVELGLEEADALGRMIVRIGHAGHVVDDGQQRRRDGGHRHVVQRMEEVALEARDGDAMKQRARPARHPAQQRDAIDEAMEARRDRIALGLGPPGLRVAHPLPEGVGPCAFEQGQPVRPVVLRQRRIEPVGVVGDAGPGSSKEMTIENNSRHIGGAQTRKKNPDPTSFSLKIEQ